MTKNPCGSTGRRPELTVTVVANALAASATLAQPAIAAAGFTSLSAVSGSAMVTAAFSPPVKCSTVTNCDVTATVNGAARTIGRVACTGTSDATVRIALSGASAADGDSVAVTLAGRVVDRAGSAPPPPPSPAR